MLSVTNSTLGKIMKHEEFSLEDCPCSKPSSKCVPHVEWVDACYTVCVHVQLCRMHGHTCYMYMSAFSLYSVIFFVLFKLYMRMIVLCRG